MPEIRVDVNFSSALGPSAGTYSGLTTLGGFMWSHSDGHIQFNEAILTSALWYGSGLTYGGTSQTSPVTGGILYSTSINIRPGYNSISWSGLNESAAAIYNGANLDALFADDTFYYTATSRDTFATLSFAGNAGNDRLFGSAATDLLYGRGGDDILAGGLGNDTLDGGANTDRALVTYAHDTPGVTITGTADDYTIVSPDGTDRMISIENIEFANGVVRNFAQIMAGDDFAASTATVGNLLATQAQIGVIDSNGDRDWFRIELGAGFEYTFLAYGALLANPILRLYDFSGSLLLTNDDTSGLNSQIVFSPSAAGTYYIGVGASGDVGTGTYHIGVGYAQPTLFDNGPNSVTLPAPGGAWHALDGTDVVIGTAQTDMVFGEGYFDYLYGGGGNDFMIGGTHEDVLVGDAGHDVLDGGDGNDVLSELFDPTNSGADAFYGGNGVDIMYSAAGDDAVYGGTDIANNYGNLGTGNDTYVGANGTDVVEAGSGNDRITGGNGDDSLYGEIGDDTIYGGAGIDLVAGWDGDDFLDGGDDNDLLVGDAGNDTMLGGGGIDVLYGFANDDTLNGGTGGNVDALYGGTGNDNFQVGGAGYGVDYIYDFQGGTGASDRILIATGAAVTSLASANGNYYITMNNGSQAVVVGVALVLPEDIVANGF